MSYLISSRGSISRAEASLRLATKHPLSPSTSLVKQLLFFEGSARVGQSVGERMSLITQISNPTVLNLHVRAFATVTATVVFEFFEYYELRPKFLLLKALNPELLFCKRFVGASVVWLPAISQVIFVAACWSRALTYIKHLLFYRTHESIDKHGIRHDQSSSNSEVATPRASANLRNVAGLGSTRSPVSICPIVLCATPVISASSVWVRPAPRRSRFSFCPVVATVGIISVFLSPRMCADSDLIVLPARVKRNQKRCKHSLNAIRNGRIAIRSGKEVADVKHLKNPAIDQAQTPKGQQHA